MLQRITRPHAFRFHNGEKATLPFSTREYQRRLAGLRKIMSRMDLPAVLLTSMHNVAYYSGFLYCSFGRPYACVVTHDACTTVSANIDAGQPWRRSFGDNLTYTDWQRGNYWRAIRDLIGEPGRLGGARLAQHGAGRPGPHAGRLSTRLADARAPASSPARRPHRRAVWYHGRLEVEPYTFQCSGSESRQDFR